MASSTLVKIGLIIRRSVGLCMPELSAVWAAFFPSEYVFARNGLRDFKEALA